MEKFDLPRWYPLSDKRVESSATAHDLYIYMNYLYFSANWNETELFAIAKNPRLELTTPFLQDVENLSSSQIVNWLIKFDYNQAKNGFSHSKEEFLDSKEYLVVKIT